MLNILDTAEQRFTIEVRPSAFISLAAVYGPDGRPMKSEFIGSAAWPVVGYYAYGRCHLWALALHEATGWPIVMAWDIDADRDGLDECGRPPLVHAWCRAPDGNTVDALGQRNEREILDGYEHVRIEIEEWNAEGVRGLIERGTLGAPEEGEMENLAVGVSVAT